MCCDKISSVYESSHWQGTYKFFTFPLFNLMPFYVNILISFFSSLFILQIAMNGNTKTKHTYDIDDKRIMRLIFHERFISVLMRTDILLAKPFDDFHDLQIWGASLLATKLYWDF